MVPQNPAASRVALRFPLLLLLVALAALAALPARAAAADWTAETAVRLVGAPRGICVLVGDKGGQSALAIARTSELTLYVQLAAPEEVQAARQAADAAGLLGTRLFIEQGTPARIALADNVADAVLAPADAAGARAEILRVLRPDGAALLGDAAVKKPWPAGVDDWSHPYHGPDNNPQSADRLARAPFLTQFIAEPRYAPAPQAAVAAGGRLFLAFGHVAWHDREEPMLNTLLAVNAFNGALVWKRALRPGIMVDRGTMIATPTTLYLADDASCKLLDAATGQVRDEIVPPPALVDGTFWKWMALEGGVLYALVGAAEPSDADAKWKSANHGWPWDRISGGYNQPEYPWGFGRTLLAIDPGTKKVLWTRREETPIDSRAVALKNGRIYITSFGKYLACLDAASGRDLWRRTADKDPAVFEAIGPYRPGHGYVGGWKSTVYLKAADRALYVVGPQVNWLTALSADDGRVLWKYPAKDLHIVVRSDGLYTIGPQGSAGQTRKLDPMTGETLATYPVSRRACTRSTGSADGIFFRAAEGSVRLDLAAGQPQWIASMRPQCHVGVIVASGHLYWAPWACDCDLQMFGVIGCAPAGSMKFDQEAVEEERLEKGAGDPARAAPLDLSPADWPTYRAANSRAARTAAAVPQEIGLLWEFAPKTRSVPTAPVAAGGLVLVGGTDGAVRALDAATGRARWTAYTGGAVRYPPAIADGRAFAGSADGWAYVFEAATGRLLWRFRAAPAERKIPLYGALVSTWPVVGVLVEGGTAYLAAGMNSYDGTYVYALDAASGRIRWQNVSSGHLDAFSRRGVAAQGEMLLDGGRLYLAGGNAVSPGVYDAAGGKCLSAPPATPGSQAPRGRELNLAGGRVAVSGQPLYSDPAAPVFDKSCQWDAPRIEAANVDLVCRDRKTPEGTAWEIAVQDKTSRADLRAVTLPGEPVRWGVAVDRQGRVLVALRDGRVLAYGAK